MRFQIHDNEMSWESVPLTHVIEPDTLEHDNDFKCYVGSYKIFYGNTLKILSTAEKISPPSSPLLPHLVGYESLVALNVLESVSVSLSFCLLAHHGSAFVEDVL